MRAGESGWPVKIISRVASSVIDEAVLKAHELT
jgi:hypothetical protein